MQSENIEQIADALAMAQASIRCPPRNREVTVRTRSGDSYKFSYTTLDTLIEAVRGPLTSNGIWFVQSYDEWDDEPAVMTTLVHASGQWLSATTPMFLEEKSNQKFGSAFTYARRYGLSAILGLSSEEDDDANAADGNVASGKSRPAANDNRPAANDNKPDIRVFLPPIDPVTGQVTPHAIVARNIIEWGGIFIAALDQAKSLDEVLAWEGMNSGYLDNVVKPEAPKVHVKVIARLEEARARLGAQPLAAAGDIVVPPDNKVLVDLDKAMATCKTRKGVETAWSNRQAAIDKSSPPDFDIAAKLFDQHLNRVAPRKK
jgi:hypothetical protein